MRACVLGDQVAEPVASVAARLVLLSPLRRLFGMPRKTSMPLSVASPLRIVTRSPRMNRMPELLGGSDRSVPMNLTASILDRIRSEGQSALDVKFYPRGDHRLRYTITGKRLGHWPRIKAWLRQTGVTE